MFVVLQGLDHKENVSISGLNTRFRNRYTDFLRLPLRLDWHCLWCTLNRDAIDDGRGWKLEGMVCFTQGIQPK